MIKRKTTGLLIGPLQIESLANGGNGIAREQGRVIFVPGAFPGDVVRVRLTKEKKNYAEAEVVEILQASPQRRTAPCPVAEQCGGCQWQQLPYAEQLDWKQRQFADTLTRQAGVDPQFLQPIVPSDEEFGYRSRVQVKCFNSAAGFITGFFKPKSRFVVAIDQCPLMAPGLNQLLVRLREKIAPSIYAQHISQIDLAIDDEMATRAVVHYRGPQAADLASLIRPLAEQFSFGLLIRTGREKSLIKVHGHGDLKIKVDQPALHLNYAAGGFAQINLAQNRRLVSAVLDAAQLTGAEKILDLYCGMGNFSLPLARQAEGVCGVEDFAPSIDMAKRNAVENGINNVDFYTLPAEEALQKFTTDFDLLVLDPPRSGAYAVVEQLLQRPIAKIIYVSCDPQTLARDLKPLLAGGYHLLSSQAFDMFPQTFHVESLSVLEYRPA